MSKAEKNTGVVGHRRTGIQIMGQLIGLVRPLLPVMCAAILLGVIGYLCAIFLTILAGYGMIHGILSVLGVNTTPENAGFLASLSLGSLAVVLVVLAVLRGVLHYGEERHRIKKGSSFYYNPSLPHSIENTGNGRLKIIWVSTPPSF